jgi:intracellular septation protein
VQRRIPPLHALSAVLVLLLGAATLLLHNRLFIQWKPTVFLWVIGAAFLGSSWVSAKTLTEHLIAPALGEGLRVSASAWRRLNFSSAAFYALLGALNLAVAYHASEGTWVNFKIFGLTLLTVGFVVLQALWLSTRAGGPRAESAP